MSVNLYPDPTYEKVLREQYRVQKCQACLHLASNGSCQRGYASFYQCRDQGDGFKARDDQ